MKIKIIFYKSSSKYYDARCKMCERFAFFKAENSINTLILTDDEVREELSTIELLLNTFANWKKTEYYIDEERSNIEDVRKLISVISCENNYEKTVIKDNYCYEAGGWGCRYIEAISLTKETYFYSSRGELHWYDFGHFEDEKWIIDKDRIYETLEDEIMRKNLELCSHFSKERVKRVIERLSDIIDFKDDDECKWEYKYREAPFGMNQTEIIGVRPKEDYAFGGGMSFRIGLHEKENEVIEKEKNIPSITFAEIGGMDDVVRQVREVIELPLVAPDIFEHYQIKPHKGILLYGPPGCGKTLIARAIANEIGAHFITVNGPEILNKYIGQSEQNIRKIFDESKRHTPSVIYFDEFDSIASSRDADANPLMTTVVNQLLTLMDGMDYESKICCIASTNRIDMIDEAIKRPGRFDYVIEIKKPSPQACRDIFRIHTKKMPIVSDFDKDAFVDKYLVGKSGADIAFVSTEAAYNSIRRTVDIGKIFDKSQGFSVSDNNMILEIDFEKAANTMKESRSRADMAKFRYLH